MRKLNLMGLLVLSVVGSGLIKATNDGSNFVRTTVFLSPSGTVGPSRVSTVYYDGMGREVLTVSGVTGDPSTMTAVRSDYDLRGNLWNKWLPVPGDETCLKRRTYETRAKGLYGDAEIPYTTYEYEETARNRLVAEKGPGLYWQGKETRKIFYRNTEATTGSPGELSCQILTVGSDGSITVGNSYKPATLRITETTDEDGIRTLVFENRAGNVVMKRTVGIDGLTADTRFVYDIQDRRTPYRKPLDRSLGPGDV